LEKKERAIKQRLEPFMQKINSVKNSNARHILLKELYWSFSYYPFYSLRSLASLFIQIPMLFAAYEVLTKNPLSSEQFLFLKNLGKPDFLLYGINVLPMAMTAINAASVFISTEAKSKERRQGIFIAMLFFVLLYTQNSALLLYWTFNQLFNFARYAFIFKTTNLAMPKNVLATLRSLVIPKPSLLNFALSFSAMAFPAVLIYKQNAIYFVGTDLQVYIAVLFALVIILALLFKYWIAASIILSLMFFPMFRALAYAMDSYVIARFLCTFVFLYFVWFFAKQKFVLITFFTLATIYCAIFARDKSPAISVPPIEIPQELAELDIKDSASVYLFMHDAFPHREYANHLKLPDFNELLVFFEKNDFNVYNVYSLADNTLGTMYSVFQLTTDILPKSKNGVNTSVSLNATPETSGDYYRYFLSGNNIANLLFQNKGYKTGVSNICNRWFFQRNNYAYDFYVNDKIGSNLVLKAVLERGKLNIMLVDDSVDFNIDFAKFAAKTRDKTFAWTAAGPWHSSGSLSSGEAELKRWLPDYNDAVREMQIEIDAMVKGNPNAIVIFMSDHGPYLMDVQRIPKNYDFNKTDYMKFRDIFGAFMAVRWPDKEKAAKYDKEFNVTQDVFPIVFAYLFDSEIPLKYKAQNTEVQLGPHKFDKGAFYKDFYK
jgi:hypothetical protein